jgi:hypothetical protein
MQWNLDQCAVVGIGRLFFQLASGCNWLAGALWQALGLDNNSETMFCASKEVLVKVLKEYAKRTTLLLDYAPGKTKYPRCT